MSPARQRLAASRNRVLGGGGVTRAAKRTQGVCRPRDRASKTDMSREPTSSLNRKAAPERRCSCQVPRSRRGLRAGHVHIGAPRNLGDAVVSVLENGWAPVDQVRARRGRARTCGSEQRAQARYCQAKATKRGVWTGQNSASYRTLVILCCG